MFRKIIFASMFGSFLFNYSYSMEDKNSDLDKLIFEQQYAILDSEIRKYSSDEQWKDLYKYAEENGDVCVLYHVCRKAYLDVYSGKEIENKMQVNLLLLLMRVYIDIYECSCMGRLGYEDIYHLLRDKVRFAWHNIWAQKDFKFSDLVQSAARRIPAKINVMNSPFWVCFCTKAMLNVVGLYPYTIKWGNVEKNCVELFRQQSSVLGGMKKFASDTIKNKLDIISAAQEKSNKEKWEAFLSLSYQDIAKVA